MLVDREHMREVDHRHKNINIMPREQQRARNELELALIAKELTNLFELQQETVSALRTPVQEQRQRGRAVGQVVELLFAADELNIAGGVVFRPEAENAELLAVKSSFLNLARTNNRQLVDCHSN